MWNYNYTDELYHYGVPGMKWGVRKARGINVKLLERKRKRDKAKYVKDEIGNVLKPGKPGDSIEKSKANKREYEYKDAKTAFLMAKQKAKDDSGYKNSSEYKTASREFNKQRALKALRGIGNVASVGAVAGASFVAGTKVADMVYNRW